MSLDLPPDIAALRLCDAVLLGMAWDALTSDFRVALQLGDKKHVTLVFRWASDLRIDLAFPRTPLGVRRAGPAMTSDVAFSHLDCNRWKAVFDFGSQGVIQLEFDDVCVA